MNIHEKNISKSHSMYVLMLFTWAVCLIYFNPKLFSILEADESTIAKTVYFVFVSFLNLFWLYGIYHFIFLIYKIFRRRPPVPSPYIESPSVAILYTTRNDFAERAVASCVRQEYSNFHVYLLDDSTDETYQAMVDQFHYAHPQHTTVVRRPNRSGFKAGNLNNALRHHATQHAYFAVVDADEVLPADFLTRLLPYFRLGEDIAFVQAHHEQNPQQPSRFAQDLAPGIHYRTLVLSSLAVCS